MDIFIIFSFQKYVGEITLVKDKQNAINDVVNGFPILYRVRFPLQNPIPKLTAIYYNDQLICSGPRGLMSIEIFINKLTTFGFSF